MTDSGVVLVGNAYAQSRSGASMIRHLLCGMLCAALLLLPAAGRANPGDLDPTFGIGGKVTTGTGTDDYGYAVAIQADGKLVVAGETDNGTNYDVALARYFGSATTSTTTTTLPSPCGDVNGDGSVDIADALIVAQYDVGLRQCGQPPFTNPAKCDVNQDASCTIGDALRMAQCDVGIVSCTFGCLPLACP